jgi:hypothetical protein
MEHEHLHVLGVDFTSRPRPHKPITCAHARREADRLYVEVIEQLPDFSAFEALLRRPGPWLGGFDFPFSLPRDLVLQLAWPLQWRPLMQEVSRLSREAFRERLDRVRQLRPFGARYLHRAADLVARSSSPMKLHNPPVGLMLYEGAPRLAASGITVYPCAGGDTWRIALEAYPALLARQIVRGSYKSDTRSMQSPRRSELRGAIVDALVARSRAWLGFDVVLDRGVERAVRSDGSGDHLDAVLCACAAAWAHLRPRFGCPPGVDRLEGWIVGPLLEGKP